MFHATLTSIIAAVPNPGQGSQPPGTEGFQTILKWAAWVGLAVCVLGVIIAGGSMAVSSRRGEGGEHMSKLGWVLGGCIIIGAASGLVGAVL